MRDGNLPAIALATHTISLSAVALPTRYLTVVPLDLRASDLPAINLAAHTGNVPAVTRG